MKHKKTSLLLSIVGSMLVGSSVFAGGFVGPVSHVMCETESPEHQGKSVCTISFVTNDRISACDSGDRNVFVYPNDVASAMIINMALKAAENRDVVRVGWRGGIPTCVANATKIDYLFSRDNTR
ncbi:MAG: hypothetical protein HRU19_01055 [Pseudobacteriovorax sp.]|nr:hypothetical protein [Pseudobacteriovorax sp.]